MNREETLKQNFNEFWNSSLSTSGEDYYSKLSTAHFVSLKKAVSCINNIITLKTALSFIDMIQRRGIIDSAAAVDIKNKVQGTNVNTNGYDIEYSGNNCSILAEVKCNIPVGKNSFGAAQINSIVKDLDGMADASKKQKSKLTSTDSYLKFMVMLEAGPVRESMQKLMNTYSQFPLCELPQGNTPLSPSFIYIVYIPA